MLETGQCGAQSHSQRISHLVVMLRRLVNWKVCMTDLGTGMHASRLPTAKFLSTLRYPEPTSSSLSLNCAAGVAVAATRRAAGGQRVHFGRGARDVGAAYQRWVPTAHPGGAVALRQPEGAHPAGASLALCQTTASPHLLPVETEMLSADVVRQACGPCPLRASQEPSLTAVR